MKIFKKQVKVNKSLIVTLLTLSMIMTWVTFQQTLAEAIENQTWAIDNNQIQYNKILKAYSDEAELNSAPEYSEKILEKKEKYKTIFKEALWDKLKKISSDNLKMISERIENKLEIIKETDKVSEEKKEKIIAQLLSLLELINERLNEDDEYSIDINLEELFKV